MKHLFILSLVLLSGCCDSRYDHNSIYDPHRNCDKPETLDSINADACRWERM